MLIIEVEFLTGVYIGQRNPSDLHTDWPPEVDRLFSALVASWSQNAKTSEGKDALRWLEALPVPLLYASSAQERTPLTAYLGANFPQAFLQPHARQERSRVAAVPVNPRMLYCWPDVEVSQDRLNLLQSIAAKVPYLGSSQSLVECCAHAGPLEHDAKPRPSSQPIYPGRLQELCNAFDRGDRLPLNTAAGAVDCKLAGATNIFSREWQIFASTASSVHLDLRQIAQVTGELRAAILRTFDEGPAPEVISGLTREGLPSQAPHLAFLPLAHVGWSETKARLHGVALCPPRATTAEDMVQLYASLQQLLQPASNGGPGEIELAVSASLRWRLTAQAQPDVRALDPARYLQAARRWATVTPIVHGSYCDPNGQGEWSKMWADEIASSCMQSGLPKPVEVRPDLDSSVRGSPPAHTPKTKSIWDCWKLPTHLSERSICHATIVFAEPVEGPLILGAGCNRGLGLCLPLE